MKSHLKNTPIFKMGAAKAVSVLAVAVLTVLALFLVSIPVPAASAPAVAVQCQASTSGAGYALTCTFTIPAGSGTVNCQSSNSISNNNGVFTVTPANCTGGASVAGVSNTGTLSAAVLTIDSNSGTITVINGDGSLTNTQGLGSETLSCKGALLSGNMPTLELSIPNGTCIANVSVLGIGTGQITTQSGSISAITSPNLILSINSPKATVTASVLGLIANITCGSSITVNLDQFVPITVPLAPCNGS